MNMSKDTIQKETKETRSYLWIWKYITLLCYGTTNFRA